MKHMTSQKISEPFWDLFKFQFYKKTLGNSKE